MAGVVGPRNFKNLASLYLDNCYCSGQSTSNYSFHSGASFSVFFWTKADISSNQRWINNGITLNEIQFSINLINGVIYGRVFEANGSADRIESISNGVTYIDNTWSFIGMTFNGSTTLKIYVNSIDVTNTTTNIGYTTTSGTSPRLSLGNYNNNTNNNHYQDLLTIWDKELSQVEINELYNDGIPLHPDISSFSESLVDWFNFENSFYSTKLGYELTPFNGIGTSPEFSIDVP